MTRIFLVVVFLCATAWAQTAKPSHKTDVSPGAPRYQIFINPNVRADTFLLDTWTGRVWLRTTYTDLNDEPDVWRLQPRIDNDQDLAALVAKHGFKPNPANDAPAKP